MLLCKEFSPPCAYQPLPPFCAMVEYSTSEEAEVYRPIPAAPSMMECSRWRGEEELNPVPGLFKNRL